MLWWVGCWDRKSSRFVCYTELNLVCAVVGGVLGQEIIKVCVFKTTEGRFQAVDISNFLEVI